MTENTDEVVQCIYQTIVTLDDAGEAKGKKLKTIW